MSTAWVIHHHDGTSTFFTSYDADWVEEIKRRVPAAFRAWIPAQKAWTVTSPSLAGALAEELDQWFDEVREAWSYQTSARPVVEYRREPPSEQALVRFFKDRYQWHAVLAVLPDAPPEVITAAYRALAHANHPDHGGSTERMQRINLAYEHLRR